MHRQTYRHFSKSAYIHAVKNPAFVEPINEANRAIARAVVNKFYEVVRGRGESVEGAIRALKLQGCIVSAVTLQRFRAGKFDTFNSFTLGILARYCGFKSFVYMLPDEMKNGPEPVQVRVSGKVDGRGRWSRQAKQARAA